MISNPNQTNKEPVHTNKETMHLTNKQANKEGQQSKCSHVFNTYMNCLYNFMQCSRIYADEQVEKISKSLKWSQKSENSVLNINSDSYSLTETEALLPEYFHPYKYQNYCRFEVISRYKENYTMDREGYQMLVHYIFDKNVSIQRIKGLTQDKILQVIKEVRQEHWREQKRSWKNQLYRLLCCKGGINQSSEEKFNIILKRKLEQRIVDNHSSRKGSSIKQKQDLNAKKDEQIWGNLQKVQEKADTQQIQEIMADFSYKVNPTDHPNSQTNNQEHPSSILQYQSTDKTAKQIQTNESCEGSRFVGTQRRRKNRSTLLSSQKIMNKTGDNQQIMDVVLYPKEESNKMETKSQAVITNKHKEIASRNYRYGQQD